MGYFNGTGQSVATVHSFSLPTSNVSLFTMKSLSKKKKSVLSPNKQVLIGNAHLVFIIFVVSRTCFAFLIIFLISP